MAVYLHSLLSSQGGKGRSGCGNRQEIPGNMLLLSHLSAISRSRHFFRNALFLVCGVLLLTHMSPTQDSSGSKIPDGEAQFTQEQLEEYYLVYKNADVRYLRTLFDAYLKNSGGAEQERQLMNKWNKE